MKFKRTILSVSISAAMVTLSACGGGGGGGGGSGSTYTNPYLRSEVPYYTPTKVATVDPLVNTATTWSKTNTYVDNITGGTGQDVVVAGVMTPTANATWSDNQITLLSWQNGTLVDKTAQWFPNNINQTAGILNLNISDFNNSGRKDIFAVVGTDNGYVDYAYLYTNTGSNFTRSTITLPGQVWGHDSVVVDLNRDGYQDVILTSYNPNTAFLFNNQSGSFNAYKQQNTVLYSTSSIAAGDFLGNNTVSLVATDTGGPGSTSRLYSWSLTNNQFNLTELGTLPTSRFNLPKWSSFGFQSHDVRAIANDFNSDGVTDVIIISRPWMINNAWPNYSEIQFLRNAGNGQFTDVTDSVLVGYNTSTSASYNPRFIDLNGDGLTDILVSGVDFSGQNNSHQFLIRTREGQYVASHANILTDLVKQSQSLQTSSENVGGYVNILQGPNNKMYLISTVTTTVNGDRQMAVYLSELGTSSTTTVQATSTAIKQTWPWMSAIQVNDMLARTSASLYGGYLIDADKIFSPVGQLSLALNGRLGEVRPLNGYLNGVKLNGDIAKITVVDDLRRDFTVDVSSTSLNTFNLWNRNTEFIDTHQINSHSEYLVNAGVNTLPYGMRVGQDPKNFTLGTPAFRVNDNVTINGQYTSLSFNPWIQLSGIWGEVKSSVITELVTTYRKDNFVGQFGILHSSTQIAPGLVTHINDITGVWAEAGYQWRDRRGYGLGLYTGVKPVMLTGGVEVKMPTSVDSQGNINYTNTKLGIQNPVNSYVRMVYTGELNKQTSYTLGGTLIDNGQYRAQATVRFNF